MNFYFKVVFCTLHLVCLVSKSNINELLKDQYTYSIVDWFYKNGFLRAISHCR